MTLRLSKLHGLGNDFLVHLSDDASVLDGLDAWSDRARRWCDRRRGIGADGLIVGLRGQPHADLVMVLHNADGSRAEMSGNGIRCLAHAEVRRGKRWTGRLTIATDGGLRTVDHRPASNADPLSLVASVDMGVAKPGPVVDRSRQPWSDARPTDQDAVFDAVEPRHQATFDLGNPHLVLLVDDPHRVDLSLVGSSCQAAYDDGINVHVVAPVSGEADAMTMRTWERGVGVTEACGTGATATALAANGWALAGQRVTVHMPGGDVVVELGDPLVLHGPSTFVADVEVPT